MASSEWEEDTKYFGQHICRYILDQEDALVRALR